MAEAAGYGCARGAGEDFEGWTRTSGRGADLHGINLIFATTPAETWVETGVSQDGRRGIGGGEGAWRMAQEAPRVDGESILGSGRFPQSDAALGRPVV